MTTSKNTIITGRKYFNFKKELGWGEIIALIALFVAGFSLYLQYISNRAEISLTNDKLISANFTDKDGTQKFFGFYRATISNNGNKPVTLLGIRPHEDLGIILTTQGTSNSIKRDGVPFKIFQIPNSILSDRLFSKEKNLWDFEDQGLEKLSMINQVISPGEVYTLNIGTVVDLFSDTTKNYSSMVFTTQLCFSNGQKLIFGAGGEIQRHK